MAKHPYQQNQTKPPEPTPAEAQAESHVPAHRRCPSCWGRRKGYGVAYSTQGNPGFEEWPTHTRTRYYKCKQALSELGPCGYTWSVTVKTEVVRVTHHTVELNTRDGRR